MNKGLRIWSSKKWMLLVTYAALFLYTWLNLHRRSVRNPACTDELLFEWARKAGAQIDNVRLAQFAFEAPLEGGQNWLQRIRRRRGLMSTRNLSKGDIILSVPSRILFSVENANATELAEERAKGVDSLFYPYICKIPDSFATTMSVFWPLQRLGLWPERSNLVLQTRRLEAALRQHYNQHFPLLFRLLPHRINPRAHSFANVVWALSAIYSRNWGVNDPFAPPPTVVSGRVVPQHYRKYHIAYGNASNVMVPVADMLNHDMSDFGAIAWVPAPTSALASPGSASQLERQKHFAVLAGREYTFGEELFTTYGRDCNARFQVGYGFSPMAPWEDLPCNEDLSAIESSAQDAVRLSS